MSLSLRLSSSPFLDRRRPTWRLRLSYFDPFTSLEKDLVFFPSFRCKRSFSPTSSIRAIHHDNHELDLLSTAKFTLPGQEELPIQRTKKHFTCVKSSSLWYSYPEHVKYKAEKYKEKLAKKILSNITSSQERLRHCINARREYYALKIGEGRKIPSWRDIEAILVRKTPSLGAKLDKPVQVKVPPAWAQKYLFSVDDFIYDVGRRHNCTVQLAGGDESLPLCTNFFISGPEKSIKSLLSSLIKVVPDIEISRPGIAETCIRHVPSEFRRPRLLPHLISKPEEWTHQSLLDYVQDLTAFDPSSHLLRFFLLPYPSNKTNYCVFIMNTIRELICNPITRSVVSREALHRAMKYFLRKNRIEYIRELYFNMNNLGLICSTETYNIMLQASAIKEDYHNFHFILSMMLRDDLVPNGGTWVAFIMSIPSIDIKHHLFKMMKRKGLLSDAKTVQNVAEQLIESDLVFSIHKEQDHGTFIEKMNHKYGPEWLSVDAVNRALAVFSKYNLTSRAFQLLEYMEERNIIPDKYTINTLTFLCVHSASPWSSIIDLMSRSKFQNLLQPDQETIRILFRLAWDERCFNMAKVIWRYACLSATSSITARKRTYRSLKKSLLSTDVHDRLRWSRDVGPVILGSMKHTHPTLLTSIISLPTIKESNVSEIGPEPLELSDGQKFVKCFNLDLQVFKTWRPVEPFGPMLWSAIKLDMCWRENREFYKRERQWFIDNAVSIKISEKHINGRKFYWD